jgi:glucokinase
VGIMLLIGDVGGTKTEIAVYDDNDRIVVHKKYASDDKKFNDFSSFITNILQENNVNPLDIKNACLAVAGPVVRNRADITNLDWEISGQNLEENCLKNAKVVLINDMIAMASAALEVSAEECYQIYTGNEASTVVGNKAIIAPGTGLGESMLIYDGSRYFPSASQGGHVDFCPNSELEIELFEFLHKKYKQVGTEMVCAGVGFPNLLEFLNKEKKLPLSKEIEEKLPHTHPHEVARLLINGFLAGENCPCCEKAIELFLDILARAVSNFAIAVLATGGIYLGGGLFYALEEYLEKHPAMVKRFVERVQQNTTMHELLATMPIYSFLDKHITLTGAKSYYKYFVF